MEKETIEIPIQSSRNSNIVLFFFWTILFFQITILKYTLNLDSIARLFNICFLLFLIIVVVFVIRRKYSISIWIFYLLPGLCMALGISLNISINVIRDFSNFGFLANLSPWLMYLCIPALIATKTLDSRKIWKYFYTFMVITSTLSFFEYLLVFEYGLINLKVVELQYGEFLVGFFTVFHPLSDGSPHYRFYGSFIEPGTFAMFLLPAIVYAITNKKIVPSIILIVALFLTDSLGGIVSFTLALILILYMSPYFGKKTKILALALLLVSITLGYFLIGDYFINAYEEKQDSRTVRENNVTVFFEKLPTLIIKSPLGIELNSLTDNAEKNKDYSGSNFTPSNQFQYGGIIAFLGYLLILSSTFIISCLKLLKNNLDNESRVVFISVLILFPFIFQRAVILDSPLYGLLFSSIFIKEFSKIRLIKSQ